MSRISVKTAARVQRATERAALEAAMHGKGGRGGDAITMDSFQNWAANVGIGTDNLSSGSTYGFNPITRNRILLEWMHRGSWIAGLAVDIPAEDMTKAGVEYASDIDPTVSEKLDTMAMALNIWPTICEAIKWGRLYGGCILVPLIDGQDMKTPLRLETVAKDQFRGLIALDRWMVDATTEDLVTEFGPSLGLPKFYRVLSNAPALRGVSVHHSRAFRFGGIKLPYQQRLMENLWDLSILERLFDRMTGFDSATQGSVQLVYKAWMRTMKVENLREIIGAGGDMYRALTTWLDSIRRFQGIEGMTIIDAKDSLEVQQHGAFSGLSEVILQMAQQLSGALQIPLVRLFGQSPAGLNSSGESELRTYYDGIKKDQIQVLLNPCNKIYFLIARSCGVTLPDNFNVGFRDLWQLSAEQKATIANTTADAVSKMLADAVYSVPTAMKEIKQSSRITGIGSNISDEDIKTAEEAPPVPTELQPPAPGEEEQPPPTGKPELKVVGAPGKGMSPNAGGNSSKEKE
jgi:phage-related protein (TIGR01555 family)